MAKPKFRNKGKRNAIQKLRVAGDVRQTQLITTYGVGSIVDFVKDTVIIAGIDDWDTGKNEESTERRKLYSENLQSITGARYFLSPKVESGSGWIKSNDIPSFTFPEILYCPKCKRFVSAKEAANANPKSPNSCCLNDTKTGVKCSGVLVASRFVVACENGHIEDFPYSWWIHGHVGCEENKPPRISMFNVGDRSDIESLWIKCEHCGKARSMANAFGENVFAGDDGYPCNGNHPHLKNKRDNNQSDCTEKLKTRLRSSSGIYYPVTISALQIPPWSRNAVKFIERKYDELIEMSDVKRYLSHHIPHGVTLDQLLSAYELVKQRKGSSAPRTEQEIYQDEYKILIQGGVGGDEEDSVGDYSAFSVEVPNGFERFIKLITVVDKLTVIEALKGFTRLKPWNGEDGELAPLSSRPKDWLPAVELSGEGIFIQFSDKAIDNWKNAIKDRYAKMGKQLSESFLKKTHENRFSPEYVLLHTFAHLFIRQLANECGYNAASIKEKIYSAFNSNGGDIFTMHGVLVYLASSDCDGSLGGLISIAENPERLRLIIENMLRKAQWCSADPLCITSTEQGYNSLNYSACHDCVLLPETSCESRNALLDRVSVVGTPTNPNWGLFGEFLMHL
jgi:hypothetical protein